ncbi:MAG: NAD(P)-dependent oxidoreductase [Selenomonadaceae bacterium]|nr:NAD(P)-dependent oxidoreductase [Selenomonadaceae bacterium]
MKKILVTGAMSMLGVATIEECLKNDIEVVAVVHRNSKNFYRLPKSARLQIMEANLDELAEVTPNFNDADVFYHFAWAVTTHEGRTNVDIQEANIRYTLDAVRLAKKCGCHKFIFAGSQAEYGLSNKPLNRDTPIRPFTAYGVSKFTAGKLAEMLCNSLGITFVWSRIVSTYGINDAEYTLISYVINCFKNNISPVLTGCEQIWDYLYAEDAARAFRLLGECSTEGVYVIGSGIGQPLKKYLETIYRLIKSNVPLNFGGKPYAKNQVMYLEADISDLKRDTGFKPQISFEEGISQILDSFK